MTTYRVAITGEAGETAKSTADFDDALDWFTNAVTEVADPEGELSEATLSVDGVVWGMVREHGLAPEGGEVVQLRKAG